MDDRPPGGTRRSGHKTPRKVQWQDASDDAKPAERGLDEHGLDLGPLEALQDRLAQHTTTPPSGEAPHTPLSEATDSPASPIDEDAPPSIPGEAYIPAGESAGLPGGTSEQAHARASSVVRAHRRGLLSRLAPRSRSVSPLRRKSKRRDTREIEDIEKEAEAALAGGAPRPGTSILSTLLALYDGQGSSASSLRGDSRPASMLWDNESASELRPNGPPHTPEPVKKRGWHPWAQQKEKEKEKEKERKSPGVFGALVASTNNISGAAAPAPSTIAPSLKRPGYHLSRYSTDNAVPRLHALEALEASSGLSPPTAYFDKPGSSSSTLSAPITPSETPPKEPALNKSGKRQKWTGVLKDLPKAGWSRAGTPASTPGSPVDEWVSAKEVQERRERRRRRKKAEIYITRHVAEIIQRQDFICKLARAMMMFGGPSHRLQAQLLATARVLEVALACMYLPDMMLLSFDDPATGTSSIKLVRQGGAFDIAKLQAAYKLYWKVIHDDISVQDASTQLDELMVSPPLYNKWQLIFFGGMCSASICSVSFNGSFLDCLISFPLGCLLIIIQLFAASHELYSNVFEITVATLFSFISAALASTNHFCYSAVASSSIVLILPGYIILAGSLELSSHNIVSGAVRVCFSVIYSLFLGFGLAIGASAWTKISGHGLLGQDNLTCSTTHRSDGPWYQRTPSLRWAFLTVPMYSFWLSLRFYAPWRRHELPLLVGISCIGWVCNHFTGTKFPGQSDISAAVGAFAVGIVANLYARWWKGNAFVIMITGILFQLPSGVANGGLFTFVSKQDAGQSSADAYLSGFQVALQLVSVAIGLTVGLGISLVCVFPIQSRRRAAGVFSL